MPLFEYRGLNAGGKNVKGTIDAENNPNGAIDNIAGVCNATRNVFGMMPHPERCADMRLGNVDGSLLFESLLSLSQNFELAN